MTTQTEALKLALEALEEIHVGNMTPMAETNWNKAIAAIKEALAHPEQEPVAEVVGVSMLGVNSPTGKHINALVDLPIGAKLYTTPPTQQSCSQRQCNVKPLTDEQKCVECFAYGGHHRLGCIKAAHGIKGDA